MSRSVFRLSFLIVIFWGAQGVPFPECSVAVTVFPGLSCPPKVSSAKGASAVVYRVHDQEGKMLLLKIQKILGPKSQRKVDREVAILKLMTHKNIAKLFDNKSDENFAYFLMQLGEKGTLAGKTWSKTEEALAIFEQLIDAVEFVHGLKFIHADIKPENVVLTADGRPLLIDFDLSVDLDPKRVAEWRDPNSKISSKVGWGSPSGSFPYMDPSHLLSGQKEVQFTAKTDVSSLGVLFYEMLHGKLPFSSDLAKLMELIKVGEYKVKKGISVAAAAIIFRCLRKLPEERPTIESLKAMVKYAKKASEPTLQWDVILSNEASIPIELIALPNTPENPLPIEKVAEDGSLVTLDTQSTLRGSETADQELIKQSEVRV